MSPLLLRNLVFAVSRCLVRVYVHGAGLCVVSPLLVRVYVDFLTWLADWLFTLPDRVGLDASVRWPLAAGTLAAGTLAR